MEPENQPVEKEISLQTIMFRFYVKLQRCNHPPKNHRIGNFDSCSFFEGLLARILETEDGLADKIGVMMLQFFDGGQVGEMMESFHKSFVILQFLLLMAEILHHLGWLKPYK